MNQNKQLHGVSFRYCNLINVVNNLHNLYSWAKEEFFKMYQDFILFDGREQVLHCQISYREGLGTSLRNVWPAGLVKFYRLVPSPSRYEIWQ